MFNCWNCKSSHPKAMPLCSECGKIQPPRYPTPFDCLGLPTLFDLDLSDLEAQYFQRQSQTHPDRFVTGSDQEKMYASQQAIEINQAYQTLKCPIKRAEALLSHTPFEATDQDPNILLEMMSLQEDLEENKEQALTEIKGKFDKSLKALSAFFLKDQIRGAQQELDRLKYLNRLLEAA